MLLWTRCCKRGRLTHLDAKPVTQSWRIYWVSFGSQSLGAFLSPTNVLSVCQVLAGNSEKNCSTAAGTWPILLAGDRNVHRWNWAPVLLFSLNRTTRVTCVFCKPQEISAKKASLLFARCQVDCVHLRNLVYLHPLEAAVLQNAGKSSGVTLKS